MAQPTEFYRFSEGVLKDLLSSGLQPHMIGARPVSQAELSACHIAAQLNGQQDGYVIPYFNLVGEFLPYYRVKLLLGEDKYKSPANTGNHLYFPRGLSALLERPNPQTKAVGTKYIVITEGEKKAACAVAHGIPAVALAGVYSWKNRYIQLPEDTQFSKVAQRNQSFLRAHIPAGDSNKIITSGGGNLAEGMVELIDYIIKHDLTVVIVFDTDKAGLKSDVQKAAAQLGYELKYRGVAINRIKLLVLPATISGQKMGLDDFLVGGLAGTGVTPFLALLRSIIAKPNAFPRHPAPRAYIAQELSGSRPGRKETQQISLAVLMELDARGKRLRNLATQDMYYFDNESFRLMPVHLQNQRVGLHETTFGAHLYKEFDIAGADQKVIQWLAAQYSGEPGVTEVHTAKVFAFPSSPEFKDCIAYQLSASKYVIVTPDPNRPFVICNNGEHGVLFEQGAVVDTLDIKQFTGLLTQAIAEPLSDNPLWFKVLSRFKIDLETPVVDNDGEERPLAQSQTQAYWSMALLYYLSPWLLRWRNTQLPIELIIGEAGSGKSSLYELRQTILSGRTRLSNMTNDIRDWYAGITSAPSLHVLDNVHFTSSAKDYRQRISDEYCRLTTESAPHIEMRKLYTTNDVLNIPVHAVYGITAIEQPFYNTDFLQRCAIMQLHSVARDHDAKWIQRQLEAGGGREGWLAHHIAVIHKFLLTAITKERWNSEYKAHNRLANYEQCLILMGEVFGIDTSWIGKSLSQRERTVIGESDHVLLGLKLFAEAWSAPTSKHKHTNFGVKDICTWAQQQEQFERNMILTNSWRLGKYMRTHAHTIERTLGIKFYQSVNNKATYIVTALED